MSVHIMSAVMCMCVYVVIIMYLQYSIGMGVSTCTIILYHSVTSHSAGDIITHTS